MWEQIQSNRRKTAALVVSMAALLFALGYVIAEAYVPGAGFMGNVSKRSAVILGSLMKKHLAMGCIWACMASAVACRPSQVTQHVGSERRRTRR